MTTPSSPPPEATDLVNAIVAFADTCEQAQLQDAPTRAQALTQSAQTILVTAKAWVTAAMPTPPPSGS
jgi:hypothetical protein